MITDVPFLKRSKLTIIVVYFFFPETRQRTLEDMDAVFISSKGYFDVVKVAKSMPHASILALGSTAVNKQDPLNTPPTGVELKDGGRVAHLEENASKKV
jgi:hypothetical protein